MQHQTLSEAVADRLHAMIVTGELAPGSPIRLAELASALDTSMMPVREALRRLESLGLVEVIPHRGAWVRDYDLEDFRDTTQTRLMVESLAVRQAAERFTDEDAAAARQRLDELVAAVKADDAVAARDAHTAFHFAVYAACGSTWLLKVIEPVWRNSERYRFTTKVTAEHLESTRTDHARILDACIAHDPDAAEEAFRAHILVAAERIEGVLAERRASAEAESTRAT